MNHRKQFLITGAVILIICLFVAFPLEYRKSQTIFDFTYTYFTLTVGLLITMYGLMGKHIFKGLLVVICSGFISFCTSYIVLYDDFWGIIPALYGGIPAGIVTGLIFLLLNFFLLKNENKYRQLLKQFLSYVITLFIVSILFARGGDWIFEISEYFKSKKEQPQAQVLIDEAPQWTDNGDTISPRYSDVQHVATNIINGKTYTAFFHNNGNFYITNVKKDTVFKAIDQFGPDFTFVDFNKDGYNDIRFSYTTNVPGINDLILYDKKSASFKAVKNFDDYPDAKPILGTKYYYSYHKSGCADESWDSDLFYIKNFETHKLANISVDCGTDSLVISKVIEEEKKLYEVFSESKALKGIDKWIFIKQYWKKNYQKFASPL
ncbi:MAG: hypothetical protein EOO96_09275 [Pedobacter sp.]|nr:MAG: hypothetical protein EOO96_09275 [Pedobacter sp.]